MGKQISKQDLVKPRTPEDVTRAYRLQRKDDTLVEPHIMVGNTPLTESQVKSLLSLLKK